MPVDEWRTQYLLAFTVMRRFFYNSTEHHDLKSLPKGKINAQVKKAALYKQWSDKTEVEKVKIAELATKSSKLCEREKQAVNARYLLQKKNPSAGGRPAPTIPSSMHASVCSRTTPTNGCLIVHLG